MRCSGNGIQHRILFGLFALCLLAGAAAAAGIVVGIDSQNVGTGGKAVIPVKITGASGVGGLDLTVTYDPAALKFVSGEAGPIAKNGMIEVNEVQPGTINIGIVDSQGISGDGNLALLTFDVIGVQGTSSPMDVVVRGAFGTDLQNIANDVAGGTITVGPPGSGTRGGILPLPAGLAVVAIGAAFGMKRWGLRGIC